MSKLPELQKKVIKWSEDRGIIQNASLPVQTLKLFSEAGEIAEVFLKVSKENNDIEGLIKELRDAIGDNLVVLINIVELTKRDAKKAGVKLENSEIEWRDNYEYSPEALVELMSIYGHLADNVAKKNYNEIIKNVNNALNCLDSLAVDNDLTLEDSLEAAYEEIKDRKGFLNSEGVFIKESDPNYERLKNEDKSKS